MITSPFIPYALRQNARVGRMALLSNTAVVEKRKIKAIRAVGSMSCHSRSMSHRGRSSPLFRSTWTSLPGYRDNDLFLFHSFVTPIVTVNWKGKWGAMTLNGNLLNVVLIAPIRDSRLFFYHLKMLCL